MAKVLTIQKERVSLLGQYDDHEKRKKMEHIKNEFWNGIPVKNTQCGVGHVLTQSDQYTARVLLDALRKGYRTYTVAVEVLANHGHYGGVTDDVRKEFGTETCYYEFDLTNVNVEQLKELLTA